MKRCRGLTNTLRTWQLDIEEQTESQWATNKSKSLSLQRPDTSKRIADSSELKRREREPTANLTCTISSNKAFKCLQQSAKCKPFVSAQRVPAVLQEDSCKARRTFHCGEEQPVSASWGICRQWRYTKMCNPKCCSSQNVQCRLYLNDLISTAFKELLINCSFSVLTFPQQFRESDSQQQESWSPADRGFRCERSISKWKPWPLCFIFRSGEKSSFNCHFKNPNKMNKS